VLGIPFDGGTTYRPGTRFGPQGLRKISALYTPYNYEMAVDLREQMTLCDAGDVFTIPANLEKSFDQISRAVSHVFSSGLLPIMIGGDHSIGFPCVRGIAECTSKKIGIVHFDRHADIQEKDLDERMHTTPWFHATNLPNVPAKNLVQVGIGGWQVPREAVKVARERETNIITMSDMERMGVDKTAEMALEMAWDGVDMVYMSFDIDSIDCGFVPGTGWPEPGGFLPREALALASKVAAEGICGMELVEVSPPYDTSDITALMGTRVIVDVLGSLVAAGKMGAHKRHIDKPVRSPMASSKGSGGPMPHDHRRRPCHHHHHPHDHNHSHADHLHSHLTPEDEAADLQVLTAQFIDGFVAAKDKQAYLRLAGVPLERPGKTGPAS
jgi:agmatinase